MRKLALATAVLLIASTASFLADEMTKASTARLMATSGARSGASPPPALLGKPDPITRQIGLEMLRDVMRDRINTPINWTPPGYSMIGYPVRAA